MKKIAITWLMLLAAAPIFAAYQYTSDGKGGGYYLMDGSTTLSFTAGDRLLPADVRDYGFFDVTTGAKLGQSGTFDAGAQIGIWYESWLGTFSSTAVDFARTLSAPHEGKVGPIFIYEVKGGDAPSGQPLPGVLATLLIGGGIMAARRMRRN